MSIGARDALVSVVEQLRSDDTVVNALYVDSAGQIPADPTSRERIYPGSPARTNKSPVEIAVMITASGSSTSKTVVSRGFVVDCAVVAKEPWYEEYQSLALLEIFDAVADLGVLAPAANLSAQGQSGSAEIQVEESTGRRVIEGSWQYQTATTRY